LNGLSQPRSRATVFPPGVRWGALAFFCLLFVLICFWTLAPVGYRPPSGHPELERFGAFLALGGALTLGFPRRWLTVAAAICAIAIATEALQIAIPSRDARPIDALEKLLGGLTGVAVIAATEWSLATSRQDRAGRY
jgi:hypothetical protein